MFGDDVDHTFGTFEPATDHHRRCAPCDLAKPRPTPLRDHDVDETGLVLEIEEGHTLGRHRALTVGDHTRHRDPRVRLALPQARRRDHPQLCEAITDEPGGMAVGRHPGRPQVGDRFLDRGHPRQGRGPLAGDDARQPSGPRLRDGTDSPECLATFEPETLAEQIGGGHRLEVRQGELGHTANEILGRVVRTALRALALDLIGQFGPDPAHRADPEPNRRPTIFQGGAGQRRIEVRGAYGHTVPASILHQRVRRPEPHRLSVDECRTERGRLVELDPRRGVHEIGEADRV